MADTKNYGLKGVGDDVQFGKAGPRINLDTGSFEARNATDAAYVNFRVLDPVVDADAATKAYVDNVAAGLDPKESCRLATTAALAGASYNSSGGAAGNGQFTSAPVTIDGETPATGDRILVKNQGTATQNGIYVVTGTVTTWDRADDHNSNAEVSAGNFTFIEEGTTNADSGWVLQGPDPLTINTSNLNWVLFSTSSDIVAGTGLAKTGNVLDLDFSELTSASTIALADELIFQDGTVESRITVTNFLADRDIVTATGGNGILAKTANDTYAARTLTASAVAGDEGISIVNGDGVAGNPTIGIDIIGQTSLATVETGDEMLISDANASSANKRVTVDALKTFMNAGTSSTSITEGDSTLAVADAGTGTLTWTADGTPYWVSQATDTTFQHNVIFEVDSATTNADIPVIKVSARSTGTPAAGIGPSIEFEAETSAGAPGNLEVGGLLALAASDVTSTSEDFDFVFQLMSAGAAASEVARITSTGSIFLDEKAEADPDVAGQGQIWVDIATTNDLYFTDDTGQDVQLTNNGAIAAITGTVANNQVVTGTGTSAVDSSANLTFDGTTLTVTGVLIVDEITIDGDTISNNTTDQPLILRPNGTGSIIFQNGSSEEILELNDTVAAVNGLAITAGATGNPPQITTGTGAEANIDIGFLTNGTGVISVTAGTGNYEDNVTADDDIPNKKYVDDAIAAGAVSGGLDSVANATVALTAATTVNIGAATGIPANATILQVIVEITTASDAATTLTVGDATNGAASYMAASENDPETLGIYIADGHLTNGGAARQAIATVATPGTVGNAEVTVIFRHA